MLRSAYKLLCLGLGITLSQHEVLSQDLTRYYPVKVGAVTLAKSPKASTALNPRLATLRLGAGEHLGIAFDLLRSEASELYYRLSPRDSRGEQCDLQSFEAFTAFAEQDITDVRQGLMTGLPYIHYRFELSEAELGFKTSGRYVIEVFERGADEEVLLSIPLYVYEGELSGRLQVTRGRLSRDADKVQAVEVELNLPARLSNLRSEELWLSVLQNESEDFPTCELREPSQLSPERWIYAGHRAAKFWAGNEYRYIEHLALRPEGYGIVSTGASPQGWATMQLAEDRDARQAPYQARQDRDGRQSLRSRERADVAVEGEYHIAEFSLRSPRLDGYDVLLEGQAFDYVPCNQRRMLYDEQGGVYRLSYPLKNGYQEYRYVLRPHKADAPAPEPIDGSHYQTQNSYQALVYYRSLGSRHDRLLGILP